MPPVNAVLVAGTSTTSTSTIPTTTSTFSSTIPNVAHTYRPLSPAQLVDTRPGGTTATGPTSTSFLSVWPTGEVRPNASNLNVVSGQTVPYLVIAKVGAGGQVSVYNNAGSTHLIIDVAGWFPTG
ncbi:MAG: hypothetical protein M3256_18865 [Actinomycetota bacterium]|nr:hypothetical protein [Actinomycetota bacterium]